MVVIGIPRPFVSIEPHKAQDAFHDPGVVRLVNVQCTPYREIYITSVLSRIGKAIRNSRKVFQVVGYVPLIM